MIWLLWACQQAPVAADPQVGSLVLEQIRAPGLAIGEAFLVVGPDGTSVLIDVADDPHADAVREALVRHTGEEAVDHVVLTHLHMDHIGGFDTLFPGVAIRGSVVLRSPTPARPTRSQCAMARPRHPRAPGRRTPDQLFSSRSASAGEAPPCTAVIAGRHRSAVRTFA